MSQTWETGGSRYHSWRILRDWLIWCHTNNCFCPADRERSLDYAYNVAPYVSSPGSGIGGLHELDQGVFRVAPDRGSRAVHWTVASRVSKVYGKDLYHFCHMGKEDSVYAHALNSCMTHFRPDFRLLFDNCPLYDTARHVRRLGLEGLLPGLCAGADGVEPVTECDPYVRGFAWKNNGCVLSEGLGINLWGVLVVASLLESSDLHPAGSGNFARNVLGQILTHAPVCVTPGNVIPLRNYNVHSGKPQFLIVPASASRPEHFLRPVTDENFATSGELTYCRAKFGLLPEDVMHCANVMGVASFLKCDYLEVTASLLRGPYHLVPRRRYPVWRRGQLGGGDEAGGDIVVENGSIQIRWTPFDAGAPSLSGWECVHVGVLDWEAKLRELSLIVLPMISRPCAAVWMGSDRQTVGLIVPAVDPVQGDNTCVNFSHDDWQYLVLCGEEDVRGVTPLYAVKSLINVGTILWIVPGTPAWRSLERHISSHIPREEAQQLAISVRLNVPSAMHPDRSKLFVTYLVRPRAGVGSMIPGTIGVDPWELMPAGAPGWKCAPELVQ